MKKITMNMLYVISFVFLAYMILSFAEVNAHNMTDRTYNDLNLFVLLSKARL